MLISTTQKIHFIGVGGIGMSGLAEILINLDYTVSGSDLSSSSIIRRLEELGLRFYSGHAVENVSDSTIVVVSAAVPEENIEVVSAREQGIPILHRSEVLADILRMKPNAVVVGGSHGKTTTTSMISAVLDQADIGATSIIGGILHRSGTNARWGTGDYIVAEADEHDGSFLRLHPTIGVVTNIDAEHMEYYGTLDTLKRAFVDFCNGIPFYGYSVLCGDSVHVREILDAVDSIAITYGLGNGVSIRGTNMRLGQDGSVGSIASRLETVTTCIDVICEDDRLKHEGLIGTLEIHALGENNIRNALAACTVGLCLGLSFEVIQDGLRHFDGIERRLQLCGESSGVTVIEDYAHHPTEIASTLQAIRWMKPSRVICVFQPHLYSRTKFFSTEFATILSETDLTLVTDIYPSREEPIVGIDSGLIVDHARSLGAEHVELVHDLNAVPDKLVPRLVEGDVVLVLGAGDINKVAPQILERLEAV